MERQFIILLVSHGLRIEVLNAPKRIVDGIVKPKSQRLSVPSIGLEKIVKEILVLQVVFIHEVLVPIRRKVPLFILVYD